MESDSIRLYTEIIWPGNDHTHADPDGMVAGDIEIERCRLLWVDIAVLIEKLNHSQTTTNDTSVTIDCSLQLPLCRRNDIFSHYRRYPKLLID